MFEVWVNENDGEGWHWEMTFDHRSEARDYITEMRYSIAADRDTLGYYQDIDYKIKEVA